MDPGTGASGESVFTDGDENCVNINECDTGDYECSEKERCSDTEGMDHLPVCTANIILTERSH